MASDYQRPASPSWQIRMIQVFVVITVILLVFVGLTSVARRLASGISNESTATVAIQPGNEVAFEIEPGSPASVIAADLVEAGVIGDAGDFQSSIRSRGVADQLKAGSYVLVTGTEIDLIIDTLVAGPDLGDVYNVTVIEGLTIDEVLASLAEQTPYNLSQLKAPLTNGTVDSPYLPDEAPNGSDDLVRWEGLLAPDTYEFREDASPADILGRMADTLAQRVSGTDWGALETLDLDPYEGLIVASLIEKEAKLDEERPIIASVIANRLDAGIALQIDATIIYALGVNPGEVTTADLEVDSPYNTYLHPGLPPTPIGGVRLASIEAAAAPADTEYYYYVLIDSDGTHGFSETLEEHNRKKAEAKEAGVLTP
ncbi:MAG: endolytic transglycosylase MltG [Acidimicrobiia bacterium]|nr:endolytic transglycosylase MltG [Acidimicrobiia bacterium]